MLNISNKFIFNKFSQYFHYLELYVDLFTRVFKKKILKCIIVQLSSP